MSRPQISIIFAMDKNRVIGKDNKLPWHLPAELAYFKRVTMGHPIIMGRKTHESIGKPLAGRENVVVTRDPGYTATGCTVVHSVQEVLDRFGDQEVFVIGGAQMMREFLPMTHKLYMTRIDHAFEGDTFFPEINEREWRLISQEEGITDEKNPFPYHFLVYEKL